MRIKFCLPAAVLTAICSFIPALSETLSIDPARSVMTIRVLRSGLFSAFAHNHEIEARGLEGQVRTADNPSVALRLETRRIKVLDPKMSPDDRAEVQQTMEGPKVLDIKRFPEIRFQSASARQKGAGKWEVSGNLTLHGQTRPVTLEVIEKAGRYTGQVSVLQRDFGIEPVSLFGGTVKVKNEVTIEFDIQTTGSQPVTSAEVGRAQ
ncbi:MAG: YceI family protein [Acidobacteria bacterium]|nr:MAG: YceI family protein [Acidobacteriota bacterium]